jgi:deoxyribodipyrimidine photo-lyase
MATAQLVWFKRDLRVHDHAPLSEAARRGPVLCLYIHEPELIQAADFDAMHLGFINEALDELERELAALGLTLARRRGEACEVLAALQREVPFTDLWSHEETTQGTAYARDVRVAAWCRTQGVAWHERAQTGVIRRLADRRGWATRWERRMQGAPLPVPIAVRAVQGVAPGARVDAADFGLEVLPRGELQRGGRAAGLATLDAFLSERGRHYSREMSSPVTAWQGCSRISPYLAWGCVSMREVHQRNEAAQAQWAAAAEAGEVGASGWRRSLAAFGSRLRWHCHFMQKLEDEPRIEFENFARQLDGLREAEFDEARFAAWCRGQTGYPMVDACMRALHQHGWINFRMRAMLASFAAYHLWLHWRRPALFLARHFLDYEPGIHYSQFQMQSGTTGINALRIYSPSKQVLDHDPKGLFIRRYVPELARVPDRYLAEPEKMPASLQREAGCLIGRDYPEPIVHHGQAYKRAWQRMTEARQAPEVRAEAREVLERHGSRKPAHERGFGPGRGAGGGRSAGPARSRAGRTRGRGGAGSMGSAGSQPTTPVQLSLAPEDDGEAW